MAWEFPIRRPELGSHNRLCLAGVRVVGQPRWRTSAACDGLDEQDRQEVRCPAGHDEGDIMQRVPAWPAAGIPIIMKPICGGGGVGFAGAEDSVIYSFTVGRAVFLAFDSPGLQAVRLEEFFHLGDGLGGGWIFFHRFQGVDGVGVFDVEGEDERVDDVARRTTLVIEEEADGGVLGRIDGEAACESGSEQTNGGEIDVGDVDAAEPSALQMSIEAQSEETEDYSDDDDRQTLLWMMKFDCCNADPDSTERDAGQKAKGRQCTDKRPARPLAFDWGGIFKTHGRRLISR